MESIYPEDHGALGDGVTDDTVAINAAIVAASAGNGRVKFSAKTYLASEIEIVPGVTLVGAGMGGTVLKQLGAPPRMISAEGPPLSPPVPLSSQAAPFDLTLNVSSTAGWSENDYLLLSDNHPFNPNGESYKSGELVRIKVINSGTQVTLWSPVVGSWAPNDAYTIANFAIVQKIDLAPSVGISNMTIRGNYSSITNLVRFLYIDSPVVENVRFEDCGHDGLRLVSCLDTTVTKCVFDRFHDDINGGHSGYGIHLSGACDGVAISNCHFNNCRHGITTGANGNIGMPHRVVITGCTGTNCSQSPFDTHALGDGITISDCLSYGSGGHGISIRTRNTRVENCQIINARGHGIALVETLCRNITLANNEIFRSGNNAHGISASSPIDGLRITNNIIRRPGADGITVNGQSTQVVIADNTVENYGQGISNRSGIVGTGSSGSGRWLVARNFIRADSGSANYGIISNFIVSSWFVDNKAFGPFGSAAFSLGSNTNLRNDVLP